jgi:hypothetical protein
MSDPLFRLVYCSRNALTGPPETMQEEVEQILASSRRNNAPVGVTGALLFNRDWFAQALEGPQGAIESLFERILRYKRHGDVTILAFEPLEARSFANWSMAYAGMMVHDDTTFAALTLTPGDGARTVLDLLNVVLLRGEAPSRVVP